MVDTIAQHYTSTVPMSLVDGPQQQQQRLVDGAYWLGKRLVHRRRLFHLSDDNNNLKLAYTISFTVVLIPLA